MAVARNSSQFVAVAMSALLVLAAGFYVTKAWVRGTKSIVTRRSIVSPSPGPSLTIPRNEPSEKADWKVYRNDGYGFEVAYPPGWSLATFPHTMTTGQVVTAMAISSPHVTTNELGGFARGAHITFYPRAGTLSEVLRQVELEWSERWRPDDSFIPRTMQSRARGYRFASELSSMKLIAYAEVKNGVVVVVCESGVRDELRSSDVPETCDGALREILSTITPT